MPCIIHGTSRPAMARLTLALVAGLTLAAPAGAQTIAITGGKIFPVSGAPINCAASTSRARVLPSSIGPRARKKSTNTCGTL